MACSQHWFRGDLVSLQLNLWHNDAVSDQGLSAIAEHLPGVPCAIWLFGHVFHFSTILAHQCDMVLCNRSVSLVWTCVVHRVSLLLSRRPGVFESYARQGQGQ